MKIDDPLPEDFQEDLEELYKKASERPGGWGKAVIRRCYFAEGGDGYVRVDTGSPSKDLENFLFNHLGLKYTASHLGLVNNVRKLETKIKKLEKQIEKLT